nr:reverse transcriptase domain-containing protein [Tanacetum cinerariifolium]
MAGDDNNKNKGGSGGITYDSPYYLYPSDYPKQLHENRTPYESAAFKAFQRRNGPPEDFDALLDVGSKILHSIERTLLEEEIFTEFDKFMAMTADEDSESKSDTEEPPFEKIPINTDYKIKTSLEEPPTSLESKPLLDNLEYVFLEEPSFLPKTTKFPSSWDDIFFTLLMQLFELNRNNSILDINVIDEILKEDFDALLDVGSKILHSIERTLLEEEIFTEFDKFMAMTADEDSESKSDTEEPPFEKIPINTDYKIKTSLEEPPTSLESKPLLDNLEYVFLEEPSFLPESMNVFMRIGFGSAIKLVSFDESQMLTINSFAVSEMVIAEMRVGVTTRSAAHMGSSSIGSERSDSGKGSTSSELEARHCKDAHLVLNWENFHFMVKEGIVLGHKVSSAGLEVDKAKINVILKLPPILTSKVLEVFLDMLVFTDVSLKIFQRLPNL